MNQSFVVGPGFSPIPAKIVSQIVAGKFVDLCELLSTNISQTELEPQLFLDGRVLLTSAPKKHKRRIEDIVSWSEAFSIYSLIVASHFPNRWKDLVQYKLLILRTYRHFGGSVWLLYDKAFREHAAATKNTDWSKLDSQLFNFYSAGAPAKRFGSRALEESSEAEGSPPSLIICKSWNRGRCSSPFARCKFAHKCSGCSGAHRVSSCPGSNTVRHQRSPSPVSEPKRKRR